MPNMDEVLAVMTDEWELTATISDRLGWPRGSLTVGANSPLGVLFAKRRVYRRETAPGNRHYEWRRAAA